MVSMQNPEPPEEAEAGHDRTGGVGEHVPAPPDDGDVDHLEGEFGGLDKLLQPHGGDQRTSDTSGNELPNPDGP
jgi:hypothetical protein